MSVLEWKKFNFYNLVPFVEGKPLQNIKADILSYCYSGSRKIKIFCATNGWIHVFYRNWGTISFLPNYVPTKLCAITEDGNILLTLHQEKTQVILQILNLQKITKQGGPPILGIANLPIRSNATAIQIHTKEGQCCIAVGFENGDLGFCRSAISRDMSSCFRVIGFSTQKITGIELISKNQSICSMFVCTDAGIFRCVIDNNLCDTKITLDATVALSSACAIHTKMFDDADPCFIVGRDDAVYCFTYDGRGPCFAIKGRKKCMVQFGENLIIVMNSENEPITSQSKSLLIIIDMTNKMIVLHKEMPLIIGVIAEDTDCYIVTSKKEVFLLRERDMETKIRSLLNKNLFDIALRLIESENSDFYVGHVNMKYGDYLLMRGDLEGAIDKYIKTIGIIDSYCVIKQLLDLRYNKYLALYLSSLVQSNSATQEHFQLLKNCNNRLDLLKKNNDSSNDTCPQHEGSICDVPACDNKCDLRNFLNVINDQTLGYNFLVKLSDTELFNFLFEHEHILMGKYADQLVNILKMLGHRHHFSEYLIPFLLKSHFCVEFLEYIITKNSIDNKNLYNLLLDLYLREWKSLKKTTDDISNFLKNNIDCFDISDVVFRCRNYEFWNGIYFIYENVIRKFLYLREFTNNSDMKILYQSIVYYQDLNANMLKHILNKDDISGQLPKVIQEFLHVKASEKGRSLFHLLQILSVNETIKISHIKEFFLRKNLSHGNNIENLRVKKCAQDLHMLRMLLINFFKYPIEYRCSICYICRQDLKLPMVYFLCQHSFHKECLSAYSGGHVCVACDVVRSKNTLLTIGNAKKGNDYIEVEANLQNVIENISTIFGLGLFNDEMQAGDFLKSPFEKLQIKPSTSDRFIISETKTKQWDGRPTKPTNSDNKHPVKSVTALNPFEDEVPEPDNNPFSGYDDNLNPFEE